MKTKWLIATLESRGFHVTIEIDRTAPDWVFQCVLKSTSNRDNVIGTGPSPRKAVKDALRQVRGMWGDCD